MKKLVCTMMFAALALNVSTAFAEVSPLGEGMYCAPTAEQLAMETAAGVFDPAEILAAKTSSVNPSEGTLYKTIIGDVAIYVSTEAVDGDCSAHIIGAEKIDKVNP